MQADLSEQEKSLMIKQQYLKDQILDRGYDAKEFLMYISSLKPDGRQL